MSVERHRLLSILIVCKFAVEVGVRGAPVLVHLEVDVKLDWQHFDSENFGANSALHHLDYGDFGAESHLHILDFNIWLKIRVEFNGDEDTSYLLGVSSC